MHHLRGHDRVFISIHALRKEGDLLPLFRYLLKIKFLSTPSARRATRCLHGSCQRRYISIHALRKEGDGVAGLSAAMSAAFLSTPSARRATSGAGGACKGSGYFYPRPPQGGRRPVAGLLDFTTTHFYPRPPQGGRPLLSHISLRNFIFLSTPSARRATAATPDYGCA